MFLLSFTVSVDFDKDHELFREEIQKHPLQLKVDTVTLNSVLPTRLNIDSPTTYKNSFTFSHKDHCQWPEFQPLVTEGVTLPDTFSETFSEYTTQKTMCNHALKVISEICKAAGDNYDVYETSRYELFRD